MNCRLYISYAGWLGARAAPFIEEAVRDAYGDYARTFSAQEIKDGAAWFAINEKYLDEATAAAVLLSSDGLSSHWQAYELGRLKGRNVPCFPLLLDIPANELGPTAYSHLDCCPVTEASMNSIIRLGFDADGADESKLGRMSEHEAANHLSARLGSLIEGFGHLKQYKFVKGRSRAAGDMRHQLMQKIMHGFCAAELSRKRITHKLNCESVPAAVYEYFFDELPCSDLPRGDTD